MTRCGSRVRRNRTMPVLVMFATAALAGCQFRRAAAAPVRVAYGDVWADSAGGAVRVALAAGVLSGRLSATGEWQLFRSGGTVLLVRGTGRGVWTVDRRGDRLRIVGGGGKSAVRDGPLVARALGPRTFVTWNGKRYRGELVISPAAGGEGLLVINRIAVEDYLRGVVPLELGDVTSAERAALEAQAVAARSYTYARLEDVDAPGRPYDLVATTTDQVYGGAGVETQLADEAVVATEGQVLTYDGRIVNAPYHSSCGGSTAEPDEVWRESPLPYLQRVSDRVPGTDHYYCEGAAAFRWTRTFTRAQLAAAVDRYLPAYAGIAESGVGRVRLVVADPTTPSGRVAGVTIVTDRGRYHVRGNDVRFVLRSPAGEILNSTSFSIESTVGADGRVASLTLHGAGNGHGVGMCQWGARGRADAGMNAAQIIEAYFPGTTVTGSR